MRAPIFYYSEEWCLYMNRDTLVLGIGHSLCQPEATASRYVFSVRFERCGVCGKKFPEELLIIARLFGVQGG